MAIQAVSKDNSGFGVIGSLFGVLVGLTVLFVVAQSLLTLYAESVINAATTDAARRVAFTQTTNASTIVDIEVRARKALGQLANTTQFDWTHSDETSVVLITRTTRESLTSQLLPGIKTSRTYVHTAIFNREVEH